MLYGTYKSKVVGLGDFLGDDVNRWNFIDKLHKNANDLDFEDDIFLQLKKDVSIHYESLLANCVFRPS